MVLGVEAELDRIPRRGGDSFGVKDQSAVADGHEEGCAITVGGGGGGCPGGGDCGARGETAVGGLGESKGEKGEDVGEVHDCVVENLIGRRLEVDNDLR